MNIFDKHSFSQDGTTDQPEYNIYGWNLLEKEFIKSLNDIDSVYSEFPLIIDATNKNDRYIQKLIIVPFKIQPNIVLANTHCALSELHTSNSNYSYPQVILKGFPLTSIEYYCGKPKQVDLDKAASVVQSFIDYDYKLCYLADNEITTNVVSFSIDLITTNISLESYEIFGKKYLCIEGKNKNDIWFKFFVFDKYLCEQIVLRYHSNKSRSSEFSFNEDFWQLNFISEN